MGSVDLKCFLYIAKIVGVYVVVIFDISTDSSIFNSMSMVPKETNTPCSSMHQLVAL